MSLSNEELRALVNAVVARRSTRQEDPPASALSLSLAGQFHASHAHLSIVSGGDAGDSCIIEPAVRCNHCGYCRSFGH